MLCTVVALSVFAQLPAHFLNDSSTRAARCGIHPLGLDEMYTVLGGSVHVFDVRM